MQRNFNIKVRNMEEKDLEQVCQIENFIFSKPWTREGFVSSINDKNNIYLVAEVDEVIVGYCGLWGIIGEGQINNVAVKADARKLGVGEYMLTQLLKNGKKNHLTSFTLEVRESNENAIHLYEKVGFRSVGIRKNFYEEPNEGAVIMWL